ncbi:hypothetical protein DWY28_16045 [Ruminococcus sp. AF24-32LB]|nr:hypothetical protein DWV90_11920 [Ruminococcus sp. AF13-37]RGW20515.1 hypothetical protein DWV87_12195 [Ruminococcus sp. AF13-28]RHG53944.1 hypothetical protein DW253_12700 [Ruminococcus sp. AM22-13]RHQ61483.1 hypothetical protein DWY28_16045 [Ruminococcus sp. AF24-32LB]
MGKSKFSYKKVIVIKLNRFEVVSGKYIEEISGQSRIGYSMSDTTDFYDMIEWSKKGGDQGSIISFYDYNNGKIYEPFQKQRNVLYGPPVYLKNFFWFLQGDYNSGKITLFRYLPDKIPELIIQFNIADVDLYNLRIIGEDIYITSEDDEFVSYYPESFRFPTTLNESVRMIVDGKVYLSAWVEEGWDDDNNCATEEYKYYEKMIVRDFKGNVLSETIGSLQQHPDGTWWIS